MTRTILGLLLTATVLSAQAPGSISGRVVDEAGVPVPFASIEALRSVYIGSQLHLVSGARATAGADGSFRLTGVSLGSYTVRATSGTAAYPPAANPTRIHLQPAQTVAGVDIRIARTPAYHVRATVARPAGVTGDVLAVLLPSDPAVETIASARNAIAGDDGAIDIPNVFPGRYRLSAGMTIDGQTYAGIAEIQIVDRDVDNVRIGLNPGFRLTGRILVEDPAPLDISKMTLLLDSPANYPHGVSAEGLRVSFGAPVQRQGTSDGRFSFYNLVPGHAHLTVHSMTRGFYVKSILVDGRETLDSGIDLTANSGEVRVLLSTKVAGITGSVTTAADNPVPGAWVVLVPDSADRRRQALFYSTHTDTSGSFSLDSLAPGRYHLYAWQGIELNTWRDPAFLTTQEGKGAAIQLEENGRYRRDLKLIPIAN